MKKVLFGFLMMMLVALMMMLVAVVLVYGVVFGGWGESVAMPLEGEYESNLKSGSNDTRWIQGISARRFMMEFRKAILDDRREMVAKMIEFPMDTKIKDLDVCIWSKKEFLDKYDLIITKGLRKRLQAPIWEVYSIAGWRGPTMCNGRIWLRCGMGDDDSVQTTLIESVIPCD